MVVTTIQTTKLKVALFYNVCKYIVVLMQYICCYKYVNFKLYNMKINKFKAPNPQWDITDFTCDKTGISIQKHTMNIEPYYTVFKIKENGKYYDIMEDVFEIIKKLIV